MHTFFEFCSPIVPSDCSIWLQEKRATTLGHDPFDDSQINLPLNFRMLFNWLMDNE